jgi:hypothetical protein
MNTNETTTDPETRSLYDRAAACAAELRALGEALRYDDYEYGAEPAALVQAVFGFLRETRGVELCAKIEWYEGCHCHGSTSEEVISEPGPEELGARAADNAHTEQHDLERAYWVVEATWAERDAAVFAWRAAVAARKTREAAVQALANAQTKRDAMQVKLRAARQELDARRHELNEAALDARVGMLAELERSVAAADARVDELADASRGDVR